MVGKTYLFISKYFCIYQLILFSKIIKCLLLNITLISHDKIIGQKPIYAIQRKFRGTFIYLQFRGTCSSIEMRKGYRVRQRLRTPVLVKAIIRERL